jgi:hypothetical protein
MVVRAILFLDVDGCWSSRAWCWVFGEVRGAVCGCWSWSMALGASFFVVVLVIEASSSWSAAGGWVRAVVREGFLRSAGLWVTAVGVVGLLPSP